MFVFGAGVAVAPPAFAAAPTVTSFTPTSGPMGTTVTVTGTGFAAPTKVSFGGITVTATVVSATKLTLKVPATAPSAKLVVTTPGGKATSSGTFTVLAGGALTPAAGPPTTATTLALSGFEIGEAVDVYLDTTAVKLVVAGKTGAASVKLTVPASATPGDHTVTAVGRSSGSAAQTTFTVRTDWTRGGFDLARTGHNPYENTLTSATIGKLTQQWRTAVGAEVQVTPAVVDGVVYAAADDGSVRAFDATTGAQKWVRTGLGSFTYSAPVVDGNTVLIGEIDGHVYALSTTSGATRWTASTGNGIYSSPVVSGGMVYVGSYDDNVYAFDRTTGAQRWKQPVGNAVFAGLSVVGGSVYVGALDGVVYAFDGTTGSPEWQHAMVAAVVAPTIAVDGVVYAASEGKDVVALNQGDGSVRWSTTTSSAADTLGYADGLVLVPGIDGVVRAYDAGDGSLVWATSVTGGTLVLASPVTTAGGLVYLGTSRTTYVLRESDGVRLRAFPAGSQQGGVSVVDGSMYLGDNATDTIVRYSVPGGAAAPARPRPASLHP